MTGLISFEAHVKIPPGEQEVVHRLQLDGTFRLRDRGSPAPMFSGIKPESSRSRQSGG